MTGLSHEDSRRTRSAPAALQRRSAGPGAPRASPPAPRAKSPERPGDCLGPMDSRIIRTDRPTTAGQSANRAPSHGVANLRRKTGGRPAGSPSATCMRPAADACPGVTRSDVIVCAESPYGSPQRHPRLASRRFMPWPTHNAHCDPDSAHTVRLGGTCSSIRLSARSGSRRGRSHTQG